MAGVLTGKEIRDKVARNVGASAPDNKLGTEIDQNIRMSIDFLTRQHTWKDLEVEWTWITVDGVASKTLAAIISDNESSATVDRIKYAVCENGTLSATIKIIDYADARSRWPKPDDDPENQPEYMYLIKDTIYYYPIPDAEYTIRAWLELRATTITESATCLISGCDEFIVAKATALTAAHLEETDLVQLWTSLASVALSTAIMGESLDRTEKRGLKAYRPGSRRVAPFHNPRGRYAVDT